MFPAPFQNARVLTGPTGSGKSALGVEIAERSGAEIISMDSMALYRGMDIGTAKPTAAERNRVPHHLIDVLNPWESASVAWWIEQAAACCRAIEARGHRVLLVGGTPLYLKALMFGLFEGPAADPELRQRLEEVANASGNVALHERLARVDPATARRVSPNDRRRIIRALEVFELTGKPISEWQQQWHAARTAELKESQCFCLDPPRGELYQRIDRRVDAMIAAGFREEVAALRRLPQPVSREAAQAVGYREMFEHLDGQRSFDETVVLIKTHSRQLAKRQLSWFRHLPGCRTARAEAMPPMW